MGKERSFKPMPEVVPVDFEDYDIFRKTDKEEYDDLDQERVEKKIVEELKHEYIKYQREVSPQIFKGRANIENFLHNQSFHWFEKTNKFFYHAVSLLPSNNRITSIDQPMGVVYVIEVEKEKTCK